MVGRWLIMYAQKTPYFDLPGYMERWWVIRPRKWLPFAVRIHHILRADWDRHPHNHPWNFRSIVLDGWYHEVYAIWKTALAEFNPVLYTGKESPKQKDESKEAFISGDSRVMIISLRAGAGLDGLEKACRTVIFGELDWSPGAHEQCIGRVDRDDGIGPVMAYFLIAEEGSDPVIADVLGIKRQQIEGVVDPNAELIERLETDTGNLKRLAETYLKKHGHQHELQSS